MSLRHVPPLCCAATVLLAGCAGGGRDGGAGPGGAAPRAAARPWEPDDALRRAERALRAEADDGTGLILWQLHTIGQDEVDGCADDVNGCDG
ncbi:hypothetical protein [Streptomyces sp. G45]|uniref:hypothetical protein n=1 Tax=Streptomyces sp. G45 TaxID=3406627 RepID=UPI003C195EC1